MKILIIRHGEPDYSIDSLTEKGWREAELLSRRMVQIPAEAYYVSPLGRARDTAKPTMEKLGREAVVALIDGEAGMEVTFTDYPRNSTYVPALMEKMKDML